MVRVIVPDITNAARLAEIARTAFEGREQNWSADDFLVLGAPPHAAMLVDAGFEKSLLIMRMAADEAEIVNLGVVPHARRQGLGRDLLDAARALAIELGIARIVLEVAVDNTAARALYQSAGYAPVGERKAYYLRHDGNRQDGLILALDLAG